MTLGYRHYRDGRGWERKAGYSRAVRRGPRIYVSGTTAADDSGDTYAQTLQALDQALAAVTELGGTKLDVVRTRVMLAPDADWEAAARAHVQVLGSVAPANTMVYVGGLIGDGYLVEVELEAEVESESS
jgi:enamine deaminase RidA (YjgF/YER057c/UK114 family)